MGKTSGANPLALLLSVLVALAAAGAFWWGARAGQVLGYWVGGALILASALIPMSLMMANQWERAVVLRLGRLQAIRGPGLFVLIPFLDQVSTWLDQRIQTTEFNAEQALSKDTVPVDVDAVVFWQIHDPSAPPWRSPTTARRSAGWRRPLCARWSARRCSRPCSPTARRATSCCARRSAARPPSGASPPCRWRSATSACPTPCRTP
jgi:hypothetical protein